MVRFHTKFYENFSANLHVLKCVMPIYIQAHICL